MFMTAAERPLQKIRLLSRPGPDDEIMQMRICFPACYKSLRVY